MKDYTAQGQTEPAPSYSSHQLYIMAGLAVLVTTIYFLMKSKQEDLTKKRERRQRIEKSDKKDIEEKTKTSITDEEERALQSVRHIPELPMMWPGPRGRNLLDSGCPYYNTYETSDKRHMAVGSLEPQFYKDLIKGLGLEGDDLPSQMDFTKWHKLAQLFTDTIKRKTQKEWTDIFSTLDACVTPVLSFEEAVAHPHNIARGMFLDNKEPSPSPKLSGTPACPQTEIPALGQHTEEIMGELGFDKDSVKKLLEDKVIKVDS